MQESGFSVFALVLILLIIIAPWVFRKLML